MGIARLLLVISVGFHRLTSSVRGATSLRRFPLSGTFDCQGVAGGYVVEFLIFVRGR